MGWAIFKVRTAAVYIRVQLGASSPVYLVKLTFSRPLSVRIPRAVHVQALFVYLQLSRMFAGVMKWAQTRVHTYRETGCWRKYGPSFYYFSCVRE